MMQTAADYLMSATRGSCEFRRTSNSKRSNCSSNLKRIVQSIAFSSFMMLVICIFVCVKCAGHFSFKRFPEGDIIPKAIREGAPLAALPQSAAEHRGALRPPTDIDCVRAWLSI